MNNDDIISIENHLILDAVKLRYGHDFNLYSQATINRRLQELTKTQNLQHLSELLPKLLYEPEYLNIFLQHITIPVTELFRDPTFFLCMRKHVLPILKIYPSLKIWHAGCASGEEAYSMAILLAEEGLLERTTLYATDINPRGIKTSKIWDLLT